MPGHDEYHRNANSGPSQEQIAQGEAKGAVLRLGDIESMPEGPVKQILLRCKQELEAVEKFGH